MPRANDIPIEMHSHEMKLEEFKEFLGPALAGEYTDVQLIRLQTEMRQMAALLFEIWLAKRSAGAEVGQVPSRKQNEKEAADSTKPFSS